ncbi:MAG: glycogen synthase [Chloroflexota bacterium]|nr:glycogen synthase [Chloroflexota bacterium]
MPLPMRIAFITAECEPWAKTGGLGDVADALARSLANVPGATDGLVDVYMPRYRSVAVPAGAEPAPPLRVPDRQSLGGAADVTILDVEANGYRLRLVDHPGAFDRDGLYGAAGSSDYPDNAWRFGLFCRAALEAIAADRQRPVDVIHIHDWHACPAVIFRDRWYADDPVLGRAAAVLTIHNLAYHGWTPRAALGQLGLAVGDGVVTDPYGIDLLGAGIDRVEMANTVSPGYARESLTPELGFGLDGALRTKGDRYAGILNGLDSAVWDPSSDLDLAATYSANALGGKALCRADLLERVGFDPTDQGPVLGMIGRLDPQKGFDLLADAAPRLLAAGARLVVLGSGDPKIALALRALGETRPDRVALLERFDRAMARMIYAGVDFFLMPSRFEPCGQGQMIALRYGTPPIVRRTGGLADTVVDEGLFPGEGTGFAFDDATPNALALACEAAMSMRDARGTAWDELVARGMAVDFDWTTGPAPHYVDLFRRAIAIRRGE